MAKQQKTVFNFSISPIAREEELNGRHYVVVPMTMILEGVHTGSQGAVYYSVDELAKTPKMWNMKPIVVEHPFRGDTATDLEVYKKQAVGMIMNTHFTDGKLKAEAWIDRELAEEKCPEILEHIAHQLPMEISTGLFSELVMESGSWNGEPYVGRIINIRADHLAILPHKQGACSLSDGAGLLINQSFDDVDRTNFFSVINTLASVRKLNNAQEYVAGSLVAYDPDRKEKETNKNDAVAKEPSQIEAVQGKTDMSIEDPNHEYSFVTPWGCEITVRQTMDNQLQIPTKHTAELQNPQKNTVDVSKQKEWDKEEEETPIQDNARKVPDEGESGVERFVELVHNLATVNNRLANLYSLYDKVPSRIYKSITNASGSVSPKDVVSITKRANIARSSIDDKIAQYKNERRTIINNIRLTMSTYLVENSATRILNALPNIGINNEYISPSYRPEAVQLVLDEIATNITNELAKLRELKKK